MMIKSWIRNGLISEKNRPSRWKKAWLAVGLILSGLTATQAANPWPDSSYLYRQYGTSPNAMNARVFVPIGYNAANTTKYPVVVFAHGGGESEPSFTLGNPNVYNSAQMHDNGQFAFVTTANQAVFPCFLVLIQKQGPSNLSIAIVDMVNSMGNEFKTAAGQSKIDLDRIVMTGLSGGGGTTMAAVSDYPNFFAAMVPLSPAPPPGFSPTNVAPVPTWFFHALNDTNQTYGNSEQNVNAIRAVGGRPIFTLYNTGNHSSATWSAAYSCPALIPWLAAQRRGVAQTDDPATVTITSPTTDFNNYTSPTVSVTIAGTTSQLASANPALINVRYYKGNFPAVDTWNVVKPTGGTVANWTLTDTQGVDQYNPNPFRYDVVAMGTSWSSSLGGNTYYSDTIKLTKPTSGDTTAPSVAISSPTANSTFTTSTTPLSLAGTASDNIGVTSVTWTNSAGGSGTATGTTSWSIPSVALVSGTNVITVTARDAANNTSTDTLTVTYTTSGGGGDTLVQFDFGSSTLLTSGTWNNVTTVTTGSKISNAISTTGGATGVALSVTGAFENITTAGSTSTSGAYPASAIQDSFFVQNAAVGKVKLTGLNPSLSYGLTFFASRLTGGTSRVTQYKIGTATATLDATDNITNVATLTGVVPASDGSIEVEVKNNVGAGYGYLGVLELTIPGNHAPVVNAGSDQTITLPASANLSGSVTDDGLAPGSASPTAAWSKISGPGTVTFGNANAAVTTATFSAAGTYVLRLTGSDSVLNTTDDVTVTVNAAPASVRFDFGTVTSSGNWNNVTTSTTGVKISNAVNTTGTATSLGLNVTAAFDGITVAGSTSSSGVYPASAIQDSFFVQAAVVGKVKLTGLTVGTSYSLTFFASRLTGGVDRVTQYKVGTSTVTLDATDNISNVVSLSGLTPAADGTLEVEIKNNVGTGYGYIGVMEVQW
jgi:poly(3-hydroxybutyrate) depolymerase